MTTEQRDPIKKEITTIREASANLELLKDWISCFPWDSQEATEKAQEFLYLKRELIRRAHGREDVS